jgi:hypothetical protein
MLLGLYLIAGLNITDRSCVMVLSAGNTEWLTKLVPCGTHMLARSQMWS